MHKRGFTLMEMLAVLLLLAVVASLAAPGIRSARFEIKNGQAQTAAKKLVEGIKNYRQASRGGTVTAFSKTGDQLAVVTDNEGGTTCTAPFTTGIPGSNTAVDIQQLFVCGFLSPKDFKGLPYTFYYGSLPEAPAIPAEKISGSVILELLATANAGPSYYNGEGPAKYAIYVDNRLEPLEYEAE